MDVSILVTVTMKIVEKEDCQMSHNTQNGHHYKVSKTSSQTSFSKKKRVFDAQDAYASIVLQCSVRRHRNLSSKIRNVQFFLFFQVFQGVPCNTCVRNLLMYENFNDDNIEYQPHSSGFFKK